MGKIRRNGFSQRDVDRQWNQIVNMIRKKQISGVVVANMAAISSSVADAYFNAKKSDIDDMYEIRSKLFHSGEFSFFEYDVNMNPYVNPVYEYFADKYTEFRRILRKTIINWIKINITEKKSE